MRLFSVEMIQRMAIEKSSFYTPYIFCNVINKKDNLSVYVFFPSYLSYLSI